MRSKEDVLEAIIVVSSWIKDRKIQQDELTKRGLKDSKLNEQLAALQGISMTLHWMQNQHNTLQTMISDARMKRAIDDLPTK